MRKAHNSTLNIPHSTFKKVSVVGLEFFVFCCVAVVELHVAVLVYRYDILNLLHYGATCIEDGSQLVVESVDEGGVVVAYLFDDEIEGGESVFQIQLLVSHICQRLKAEHFYVFHLRGHFLYGSDTMEVTV